VESGSVENRSGGASCLPATTVTSVETGEIQLAKLSAALFRSATARGGIHFPRTGGAAGQIDGSRSESW
jgi:hypothetical protein